MPEASSQAVWFTSSYSGAGHTECVEVALSVTATAVRDSKDPGGTVLRFGPAAWREFVAAVREDGLG